MSYADLKNTLHGLATLEWPENEVKQLKEKKESPWLGRTFGNALEGKAAALGTHETISKISQFLNRNPGFFDDNQAVQDLNTVIEKLENIIPVSDENLEDTTVDQIQTLKAHLLFGNQTVKIALKSADKSKEKTLEIQKFELANSRCPAFLREQLKEKDFIEIQTDQPRAFEEILHYIQTGDIRLRPETEKEILKIAYQNDMEPLMDYVILTFTSADGRVTEEMLIQKSKFSHNAYFRSLFQTQMKEKGQPIIQIKDEMTFPLFDALSYIQKGQFPSFTNNEEEILDLLEVADRYLIQELKDECENWLCECADLGTERLADWFDYADRYQCQKLEKRLNEIIDKLFHDLVKTEPSIRNKALEFLKKIGDKIKRVNFDDHEGDPKKLQIFTAFLVDYCPNIEELNLTGTSFSNEPYPSAIFENLAKLKSLQKLTLSLPGPAIKEKDMVYLLSHLHQLAVLELPFSSVMTDNVAMSICQNLPRLCSLKINCPSLANETLRALSEALKHLQILDLSHSWFKDEALQLLLQDFKHLQSLSLFNCSNLSNKALDALANCGNLQFLDCSYCNFSDVGLNKIANYCPTLQKLIAGGKRLTITDEGVKTLGTLKDLRVLSLHSAAIKGTCFTEALTSFPKLEELYLGYTLIDDNALRSIGEMQNLKLLYIQNCPNITENAVNELKSKRPLLKIVK